MWQFQVTPTSTTPNVVTVKLILLFSPMLGRTCWTTGVFSTIPDDQICTNIMTVSSSFWNSTQTYVDMLHQQIHIRVHRHTEMNQWCSHRHSGLGKGLSDWPLPPNTRQHLCTIKTGSDESEINVFPWCSYQHTSTTGHVTQEHISITTRTFKGSKSVCTGLIAGVGGYTLIVIYTQSRDYWVS